MQRFVLKNREVFQRFINAWTAYRLHNDIKAKEEARTCREFLTSASGKDWDTLVDKYFEAMYGNNYIS